MCGDVEFPGRYCVDSVYGGQYGLAAVYWSVYVYEYDAVELVGVLGYPVAVYYMSGNVYSP